MWKIVGVVGLAVVGAGGVAAWHYGPIYQVEQRVKERLNDPASARFSGVTVSKAKGIGCGFVNAKNRMGGYTGNTHFVLFPDGDLCFEPTRDDGGAAAAQRRSNYLTLVDSNCEKK